MVRLETSYLDRFISGAALGKRQIGRPLKYNIARSDMQGMVELVYNPRN